MKEECIYKMVGECMIVSLNTLAQKLHILWGADHKLVLKITQPKGDVWTHCTLKY